MVTERGEHRTVSYDGSQVDPVKRWHYGGAGDRVPIRFGEIWEVGPHRLLCGDLQGDGPLPAALDAAPPALLYVDPPWSKGIAAGYRTKAGVDGERGHPVDFDALLDVILATARGALTFVEWSAQPARLAQLDAAIGRAGATAVHRWPVHYKGMQGTGGGTLTLLAYEGRPPPPGPLPDLADLEENDACFGALAWLLSYGYLIPSDVVCDPCAGRGMVPVTAESVGLACLAHELSPVRLAVTAERLAKLTGADPVRVG